MNIKKLKLQSESESEKTFIKPKEIDDKLQELLKIKESLKKDDYCSLQDGVCTCEYSLPYNLLVDEINYLQSQLNTYKTHYTNGIFLRKIEAEKNKEKYRRSNEDKNNDEKS